MVRTSHKIVVMYQSFSGGFLFILITFMFSCGMDNHEKAVQSVKAGNESLESGDLVLAEEQYLRAIEFFPEYADAYNNLGVLHFRKSNFIKAIDSYDKTILIQNDFWDSYFNRANAAFFLGSYYNALQDIEILEQNGQASVKSYFLKALVYEKLRDFVKAIVSLEAALEIDSLNQELWINLGTANYYLKNYDIARDLAEKALELSGPSISEAFNLISLVELKIGNLTAAEEWIGKAISEAPENPYYLNNKGFILILKGDYSNAENLVNQSLKLDSRNAWAFRNKAILFYYKAEWSRALGNLKTAAEIDPNTPLLNYYVALVFYEMNDLQKACSYLKLAIEKSDFLEPNPFECK